MDITKQTKPTRAALFAAPMLALVMYFLGFLACVLLLSAAAFAFAKAQFVRIAIQLISQYAGIWTARKSCDVVFNAYSGRGIFIVFLCLELVAATAAIATNRTGIGVDLLGAAVVLAASYFMFWLRDTIAPAHDLNERRGLDRLGEAFVPFVVAAPQVIFIVVGILQLGAVAAQLENWTRSSFLAWVGALFVTYIPVIGSIIGFFGARDVWHWSTWAAAALCFGPLLVMLIFAALSSLLNYASRRQV